MSDLPRPPFAWHLVACEGTSCTEKGQGIPLRELRNRLYQRGVQERVRVTRATCLNMCSLSPNFVVYPTTADANGSAGGAWYCGLTPSKVARIVDEHLIGGSPCADLVHPWPKDPLAP
jgi:(2Fe-2S) ferredoxin